MKKSILSILAITTLAGCGQENNEDRQYSFLNELGETETVDFVKLGKENMLFENDDPQPLVSPVMRENLNRRLDLFGRNRPKVVDWRSFQTPIRSQKNRGTCTAFAKVAAIEARYKRDFGFDLDLSEQYFWHTYKSTGVKFPHKTQYENQSSFWGGGSSKNLDSAVIYAIPLETDAPYKTKGQMEAIRDSIPAAGDLEWKSDPAANKVTQEEVDAFEYSESYIPQAARLNAKYGVKEYTSLEEAITRNTTRLEQILAKGHEIVVSVNLKWKQNATTKIYEWDDSIEDSYHSILIVGYDSNDEFFWVKNSWGEADFLKVSYDFFRKASRGGAFIESVRNPDTEVSRKGRMLGVWNVNNDGWQGQLVIRRSTGTDDKPTRLGQFINHDAQRKVVNGFTIGSDRGLEYSVGAEEENEIGKMEDKRFKVLSYSKNLRYAAGAVHGTKEYGLFLTRTNERSKYGRDFNAKKWIGTWAMNHDGWRGTLDIDSLKPIEGVYHVKANYRNAQGDVKKVSGYLDANNDHIARLKISFSESNAQPFTLHFHTWTSNLASGSTTLGAHNYGVHAFKQDTAE